MTSFAPLSAVDRLGHGLEAKADPERAEQMAAYLRHQFPFFGVRSADVRALVKPLLHEVKLLPDDAVAVAVVGFAHECWRRDQREFHQAGAVMTRRWASHLDASRFGDVEQLLTTHSWWDTVDSLAAWTVGPMVRNHPELTAVLDRWIADDNIWLARTAIIHQLGYKADTDPERLFRYCRLRADDSEFFIRKAIGWALRQYARVDPDAVRAFVADNQDILSGLSRREALKHLKP